MPKILYYFIVELIFDDFSKFGSMLLPAPMLHGWFVERQLRPSACTCINLDELHIIKSSPCYSMRWWISLQMLTHKSEFQCNCSVTNQISVWLCLCTHGPNCRVFFLSFSPMIEVNCDCLWDTDDFFHILISLLHVCFNCCMHPLNIDVFVFTWSGYIASVNNSRYKALTGVSSTSASKKPIPKVSSLLLVLTFSALWPFYQPDLSSPLGVLLRMTNLP